MSLALLFHYLMLKMFRMLIHPSSGACGLFDELFHGLYCSGTMCVGVTLWFGWGGVVSVCRLQPASGYHTTPAKPQRNSYQSNTTLEISHKLLRMDVLTSETCSVLNNEILKQVTCSWSLFIQVSPWVIDVFSATQTHCTCSVAYIHMLNEIITERQPQTFRHVR